MAALNLAMPRVHKPRGVSRKRQAGFVRLFGLFHKPAFGPRDPFKGGAPGAHFETYDPAALVTRLNQFLWTEDASNAAWLKTATATVTGTKTLNFPAAADAVSQSLTRTIKAGDRWVARIRITGAAAGAINVRLVRTGVGAFEGHTVTVNTTGAQQTVDLDWTFANNQTGIRLEVIRNAAGQLTTVTFDQAQINPGATLNNYQKVTDWKSEYLAAGGARVTMFTDSAHLIPLTALEENLGSIRDTAVLGSAIYAFQATGANQPKLSARVNYLIDTDTLATQTITATNCPSRVLSIMGTGSVALTGATVGNLAGTGAANRVSATFTLGLVLATPVIGSVTTSTAGGTLAAATLYSYRVAAKDGAGKTLASAAVTVTTGAGATNSNTVNWGAVAGATGGYDIYGRVGGAEQLIGSVAAGVVTFVDTGAVAPAGALPAGNTTGVTTFTVTGSVTKADLRTAADSLLGIPLYQKVLSATEYDSDGFPFRVKHDGATDYLEFTLNLSTVQQVLVVMGGLTREDDGAARVLVEHTVDSAATAGAFAIFAPLTGATSLYSGRHRGVTAAGTGTSAGAYAAPRNDVLAFTGDLALSQARLYVNDVLDGSSNTATGGGNYANAQCYIGARAGATQRSHCGWTSLTIRGGAFTDGLRKNIQRRAARLAKIK